MLTVNVYIIVIYDVITVDYCKCILLYSPLNSYQCSTPSRHTCFVTFSAFTLYGFVTVVQPNQIIHL